MKHDIRWEQRFSNYVKALGKLSQAVAYVKDHFVDEEEPLDDGALGYVLDEIVREGLIQRFEYTHELAWNVMKDYIHFQGNSEINGSRDATREAFKMQLITDGAVWMDMIGSRNRTSHTYDEDTANEIYDRVINDYYAAFMQFQKTMESKRSGEQSELW